MELSFGGRRGFFKRIADWNDARYKRVFDKVLTHSLLAEEVLELQEAQHEVDVLDALADITYVAIGAMHKLGLSELDIYKAIHAVCDANATKSVTKTPSHIKANTTKGEDFVPPEARLQEILDERV